ncbi:hypothetical protein [Lentzea sp. NPDC059081]|uniref:hypothetical protein n=1 Tax=Lentzea sp. NPDC059081 TaxID=3346719 RepID=UPI003676DF04
MAGAVGIVFGLCVLSFTLGAALMYVLVRRREDAAPSSGDAPVERTWVEKPAAVDVVDDYDTRPIHRNPVVGLPQWEPALASLGEVVGEPEPETEPVVEAEPAVVVESVEEAEPEPEPVVEAEVESDVEAEVVVGAVLPAPAEPQAVEQTTWVEREDFRRRYLRTFDEVRRKADSN